MFGFWYFQLLFGGMRFWGGSFGIFVIWIGFGLCNQVKLGVLISNCSKIYCEIQCVCCLIWFWYIIGWISWCYLLWDRVFGEVDLMLQFCVQLVFRDLGNVFVEDWKFLKLVELYQVLFYCKGLEVWGMVYILFFLNVDFIFGRFELSSVWKLY